MVAGRVRHPKSYAWKIFVMADILKEYDTVIWVGTSIFFASDNLATILKRNKREKLAQFKCQAVKFPGHPKFVFVTAASANYFPSLRMLIANIKEHFGCQQKIIAYDLGNVTKNSE
ncbi:hypothetical protein niasHT_038916 [Heterodera trifolii]|uniref:Uncharacterized protein n=1 Tax=Heterodera trifolii TaxID=157864 RepID=A0ABD2IK19_9BILA